MMAILQNSFQGTDIARLYRLLLAYTSGCVLIAFLVSPWLFRVFPAAHVLAATGIAIAVTGGVGFYRFVVIGDYDSGFTGGQNAADPLIPT